MEFSRENKIEAIADVNRAFAEQYSEDIPLSESRQTILKRLQRTDDESFRILASFNNAWLAYDYIRSDKELRIKVEDVWRMEVERHKESFEVTKQEMFELAKKKKINLEPLMLRIKWL